MHALCLVVGDDPERQLEPFSEHVDVAPHKVFLDADDVTSMAENYELPESDLQGLAGTMPDWQQAEGGVDAGRLFSWSTDNPNRKFDFYKVGGQFAQYLHLTDPQKPSGLRAVFGGAASETVNKARKADVRQDLVLSDPPAVLLLGGTWHESGVMVEPAELEAWKERFVELFASVPDDALLTVVDVHS